MLSKWTRPDQTTLAIHCVRVNGFGRRSAACQASLSDEKAGERNEEGEYQEQ
jgi:hypothetical protein